MSNVKTKECYNPYKEAWKDLVTNADDPIAVGSGFCLVLFFTLLTAPVLAPLWLLGKFIKLFGPR